MAILKCLRDYVVADNDVTVGGWAAPGTTLQRDAVIGCQFLLFA